MRKILKAIFAALGRVVVRTVRLASGAVLTFIELLRPSTPAVDYADGAVDDAVSRVEDQRSRDEELEGLRLAGGVIQRAAAEMLEHGAVLDGTIPAGVRNWVRTLCRRDLAVLVAASPEDVARHVLGLAELRDDLGILISRPDEKRDAERLLRREEDRLRREAAYASPAKRQRSADPSIGAILGLGV